MKEKSQIIIVIFLILIMAKFLWPFEHDDPLNISEQQIERWQKGICYLNFNNQVETSGFFVSKDGMIATVYHLLRGWNIFTVNFPVYVYCPDKEVRKARVLEFSQKADLLLLQVDYKPQTWFDEFIQPEVNQQCIALGFPYGWFAAREGRIIFHPRHSIMGINIIAIPGSSGSVVLSEDGKVLGMITKKYALTAIVTGTAIKGTIKKVIQK